MLLECQLAFKPKVFKRICTVLFDPNKRAGKISFATLKHYLASDSNPISMSQSSSAINASGGVMQQAPKSKYNFHDVPSQDKGGAEEVS